MDKKEEEFLKRLQAMFKVEATEHINVLLDGLIKLEQSTDAESSKSIIETIYREAHSLKGAARSVDRYDIEYFCQEIESIFQKLKKNIVQLNKDQFDSLHKSVDYLNEIVASDKATSRIKAKELIENLKSVFSLEKTQPEPDQKTIEERDKHKDNISDTHEEVIETSEDVNETKSDETNIQILSDKNSEVKTNVLKDSIRIDINKLDNVYLQAEQLIQSKISLDENNSELYELSDSITTWKNELNSFYELLGTTTGVNAKEKFENYKFKGTLLNDSLNSLSRKIQDNVRGLGRLIDEHLNGLKSLLMLPVSSVVSGFPKQVRDLSRSQNKDVNLIINGENIEVDKAILEELKDPLIHILRNCVDHGFKKLPNNHESVIKGSINMDFSTSENRELEIMIKDNGTGVDTKNVLNTAIKQGFITKDKAKRLSEQEVVNLIFRSGFSTSPIITDISGRGLGLAIVAEKVEKLGGRVLIESEPNKGTLIKIALPLTLASNRGVLLKSNGQLFFISTQKIKLIARVNSKKLKTVKNRKTIEINGEIFPTVKLSDILRLDRIARSSKRDQIVPETDMIYVVAIENDSAKIAYIVDEVLNEQQILVKNMGKHLPRINNVSGVTVLGSGIIVPVLNVPELMEEAKKSTPATIESVNEVLEKKVNRILVVEDSITSRTLIKQILESAGYDVDTAVDGLDGYIKAQSGDYDLFVSDVDMPRMNGFELTTKIRNNDRLKEHPVVLVTSLGSKEDQEYGIDVGANAYIIKSKFEDSNLIDVVKKLI